MARNNPAPTGLVDLYRFFDSEGNLLYVGISLHAALRVMEHRIEKPWWPEVATITVEHLTGSRTTAARAERRAIKREHPRYNEAATTRVVSRSYPKFPCSACGRKVSTGYVGIKVGLDAVSLSTAQRHAMGLRVATAIAEAGAYDQWRVAHMNGRCVVKTIVTDADWVTLDIWDVWALHTGARPEFVHQPSQVRAQLLRMWENGRL